MSLLSSSSLYEALRADAVAAWSVDDVFYGLPQTEAPLPYAVIRLGSVPMQPAGLRAVEQTYKFDLIYVDAWGTDPDWNIETAKEAAANALITRLMANRVYAGSGLMPQILAVEFDETDDPVKPRYSVTITFEVIQHVEAIV